MRKPDLAAVRVLLIAPSLDITGGQSAQAASLREAWEPDPAIDLGFLPIDLGVPVPLKPLLKLKYIRTALRLSAFVFVLLRRIWKFDVLHVFSAAGPPFYLFPVPSLLIARLARRRAILNFHDARAEAHLRRSKVFAFLVRRFDSVVTPSDYLAGIFRNSGVDAISIPNTLNAKAFHFRERSPSPHSVFLSNRRLEPLYNIRCTLRAFALIEKRYPGSRLIVAHDGPQRRELELYSAELGLHSVSFAGETPRSEMAAQYDAADIYLTSPDIDNMPLSLLECFASGLPVVATNAGGIPYIATDGLNALLVGCGDHEALAQAAFRLIEEEGLAAFLTCNARDELARYGWDQIRGQWLALYRLAKLPQAQPSSGAILR